MFKFVRFLCNVLFVVQEIVHVIDCMAIKMNHGQICSEYGRAFSILNDSSLFAPLSYGWFKHVPVNVHSTL